ncbi:hypothetical protein [Nocardia sp. NPDC050710]|uniref:hypothetical protein n=1 Tax=Nocardia sp. NPDC050710 TaxID=3157220 RepID=UPI0033D6D7D4
MNNKYLIGVVFAVAATISVLLPATAQASPTNVCAADRPCITELYQSGRTVHIGWDGHQDFSHYNFRWSRPGRAESQHETGGGAGGGVTIKNVRAGTVYTVKVQGCDKPVFSPSRCTPWAERTITTR